jgi:hypothetical protein
MIHSNHLNRGTSEMPSGQEKVKPLFRRNQAIPKLDVVGSELREISEELSYRGKKLTANLLIRETMNVARRTSVITKMKEQ